MDAADELGRVARRQHGLVTRRQALAAGLTRRQVEQRLASGRWQPVRVGVYAGGWVPPSFEQAVLAVVLAVGHPCAASHGTAARAWGLAVPDDGVLHVLTPASRRIALPQVRHHRSSGWWAEDVTTHRRVPVTSVARTLVDCGPALGPEGLGALVDDTLRRGLLRLPELDACVGRLVTVGRRGLTPAHAVLAERGRGHDPGANDAELAVLRALRRAGLPPPVQQHVVVVGGRRRRLDFAYPAQRVGIEFDGFAEHGLVRSTFDDDRHRGNALALSGWLVLHFTSRSTPAEIADRTRQALHLAHRSG